MDKKPFSSEYETSRLVSNLQSEGKGDASSITLSFRRINQWAKKRDGKPILSESTITLTHADYHSIAHYLTKIDSQNFEELLGLKYTKGETDLREHIIYYLKELKDGQRI